jgi:anti-sigma regulatory factor (Ser/Thr protein kinase)
VPFNAIPAEQFLNRGYELDYLRSLSGLKANALGGNVFLEGARGMGKTELLKQLYRVLFWEGGVAPFYYPFRKANLRGTYFARDYVTRFVRQYLAFVRKEASLADPVGEPLSQLVPALSSHGLHWLIDCIENFQEHLRRNDHYGQIVAAISVPVVAAQRGGKPVIVMLDDFDASADLHESRLGDVQGLTGLFGEPMRMRSCPHVITGAAGALEGLFRDPALAAMTERLHLGPLPEDLAAKLFRRHLSNLGIALDPAAPLPLLERLQGNPLYLRNLAKAAAKMRKTSFLDRDLAECYSLDITEGETCFYWTSVLNRHFPDRSGRRAALKLIAHRAAGGRIDDGRGLTAVSGLGEGETDVLLERISAEGLLGDSDAVLRDFLHSRYRMEVEGVGAADARVGIESQSLAGPEESCFELVIPMSENAELVVAKAVEQIGRNMNLDPDFLNRLQVALIEVCINAMEHSGSYDRKVFLKMIAGPDQLKIIVENTGRPFSVDPQPEDDVARKLQSGRKRGWGFKLVHAVMDRVNIERVNDRTRVVLIKDLRP